MKILVSQKPQQKINHNWSDIMNIQSAFTFNDLKEIENSLNQPNFNKDKIGKILGETKWDSLKKYVTLKSKPQILSLIERMNLSFARLEEKGVKIFDFTLKDSNYLEKAHQYRAHRETYLNITKGIGSILENMKAISPDLKRAYYELQCREIGLRYSLGAKLGGLDSVESHPHWFEKTKEAASTWKKKQKLCVHPELNELEIEQIHELSKYPEWLKIVHENPSYLNEVFNWCLKDFNQVEVIIKCFETRRKLKVALLSANLGYVRNKVLIQEPHEVLAFKTVSTKVENVTKRILTLPIYHGSFKEFEPLQQKRVNILDPQKKIHFKQGNYDLTVEEFLHELGQKNLRESKISLCAHWGFVNFHPVNGMWNTDLKKHEPLQESEKEWLDQVPASRIASHAELVEQYGAEMDQRQFFFKVMATRQKPNLNVLDCHAYWQLFVRMSDGNWKVCNFGLYANRFQRGLLDGLWMFCHTLPRVLSLVDQNGGYTHRQQAALPFFPNQEIQDKLLTKLFHISKDVGVFQFAGRNCAYAVQNNLQKIMGDFPNLFKIQITEVKSDVKPLDRFLEWAHGKKGWIRWFIVSCLHHAFLSHRSLKITKKNGETTIHSVQKYMSQKGHEICNPALLHHQIELAKKSGTKPFSQGEIFWGHTDEKLYQKMAQNKAKV